MARLFDGTTGTYLTAPGAGFALPDADWLVQFAFRPTGAAGNAYMYMGSCGVVDTAGSQNYYLGEAGADQYANQIVVRLADDGGQPLILAGGNYSGDINTWVAGHVARVGANLVLYYKGVQVASTAHGLTAGITPSATMFLGKRGYDDNIDRAYPGALAEFAAWSGSGYVAQIASLAGFTTRARDLTTGRLWLYELNTAGSSEPEYSGGTAATVVGASLTGGPTFGSPNTPPVVTITTPSSGAFPVPPGTKLQFEATVVDTEDNPDPAVSWSSSTPSVATVNSAGLVTTLADGSTTITASATDSSGANHADTVVLSVTSSGSGGGGTTIIQEDPVSYKLRDYGAPTTVDVPLLTPAGDVAAPVFVAGDIKIRKDGGPFANAAALNGSTNDVTVADGVVVIPLTAAEMSAKTVIVRIRDQDGPAWLVRFVEIDTKDHPAARFPNGAQGAGAVPSGGGVAAGALAINVTRSDGEFLPGAAVGFSGGAGARIATVSGTSPNLTLGFAAGAGLNKAVAAGESVVSYVGDLPDKTGVVLAPVTHSGATIPAVTTAGTVTNPVTVGTNNDKTGYDLSTSARTSLATSVWANSTRTLSSFGTLAADTAAAVWAATTRTLSAFGFSVSATLSASERTAIGNALLDIQLYPGVTHRHVLTGEVKIVRTRTTGHNGTFVVSRGGQILYTGTFSDDPSGGFQHWTPAGT